MMTENAYAKINRYLNVTGVRADGYHTIDSEMQTVTLCDTLTLRESDRFSFTCSDKTLESEQNLCVKAHHAFANASGKELPVALHLEKRIPYGAGLGGGSADAAAVLRLLQRMSPISEQILERIALSLGADVPFCLHGGRMRCTGIGEVLSPLPAKQTEYFVIAKGEASLATPAMYRALDALVPWKTQNRPLEGNDFEPVAFALQPSVQMLKEHLLSLGATYALMSGSGSAVFGVFPDEKAAKTASEALRSHGYFASDCKTHFPD